MTKLCGTRVLETREGRIRDGMHDVPLLSLELYRCPYQPDDLSSMHIALNLIEKVNHWFFPRPAFLFDQFYHPVEFWVRSAALFRDPAGWCLQPQTRGYNRRAIRQYV